MMNLFNISKNKIIRVRYINTYKNSFPEYWLRNFHKKQKEKKIEKEKIEKEKIEKEKKKQIKIYSAETSHTLHKWEEDI